MLARCATLMIAVNPLVPLLNGCANVTDIASSSAAGGPVASQVEPDGVGGGVSGSSGGGTVRDAGSGASSDSPTGRVSDGAGAEPTGTCTRTDACERFCAASNSACLQMASGETPTLDVSLDAVVTSVSRQAWQWPFTCLAMQGPFRGAPTERVLLELKDTKGESWALSLPPDLVADDRFVPGSALTVDYQQNQVAIWRNRLLMVREDDQLALFFVDATSPSSFQIPGADLTFAPGAMTCPNSVPGSSGCSSAQYGTRVTNGAMEKARPCRDPVGDFVVTSSYEVAGQAPPSCNPIVGRCDAASSFVASGARRR
jgi:hypothetical protein